MYKSRFFKKYVGFNHDRLVLWTILLTSVSFPFIFQNKTFEQLVENRFHAIPIGLVYASLVLFGNLHIFYVVKRSYTPFDKQGNFIFPMRQYFWQILYTILVSLLMSSVPEWLQGNSMSFRVTLVNIIGAILFAALFISIYEVSYFITAFKRSTKEKENLKRANLQAQLEILRNQVQPHFLFNSLNTLIEIIPSDPQIATDYVRNLSKIYRYILEIRNKEIVTLSEEMYCVNAYLSLLKIRYGDSLITDISLKDSSMEMHIVPLTIQMLIENAVKHNTISRRKPLTISLCQEGPELVKVCNKIQPRIDVSESTGTGLDNIEKRTRMLLNKQIKVERTDEYFCVAIPLVVLHTDKYTHE